MTVVVNSPAGYALNTNAGGHAFMVDVDTMLVAAGLSRATFTGSYDPAGASSQLSYTLGSHSPWLAYNFSDADQATYPITVWVSVKCVLAGNAAGIGYGNAVHTPCFRVSEGVDGSGTALGRVVENIVVSDGSVTNSSPPDECVMLRSAFSAGSFCRYDADTLTLIFGANGMRMGGSNSGYQAGPYSALELHIERRRSPIDGAVQSGYAGMVQPLRSGPGPMFSSRMPGSIADSTITNTPVVFVRLESSPPFVSVGNHSRSGGVATTSDVGTPIVAPIYYQSSDGHPASLARMFTIPLVSGASTGQIMSLDFSGTLRPYLYHALPGSYVSSTAPPLYHQSPALGFLFEWEP